MQYITYVDDSSKYYFLNIICGALLCFFILQLCRSVHYIVQGIKFRGWKLSYERWRSGSVEMKSRKKRFFLSFYFIDTPCRNMKRIKTCEMRRNCERETQFYFCFYWNSLYLHREKHVCRSFRLDERMTWSNLLLK